MASKSKSSAAKSENPFVGVPLEELLEKCRSKVDSIPKKDAHKLVAAISSEHNQRFDDIIRLVTKIAKASASGSGEISVTLPVGSKKHKKTYTKKTVQELITRYKRTTRDIVRDVRRIRSGKRRTVQLYNIKEEFGKFLSGATEFDSDLKNAIKAYTKVGVMPKAFVTKLIHFYLSSHNLRMTDPKNFFKIDDNMTKSLGDHLKELQNRLKEDGKLKNSENPHFNNIDLKDKICSSNQIFSLISKVTNGKAEMTEEETNNFMEKMQKHNDVIIDQITAFKEEKKKHDREELKKKNEKEGKKKGAKAGRKATKPKAKPKKAASDEEDEEVDEEEDGDSRAPKEQANGHSKRTSSPSPKSKKTSKTKPKKTSDEEEEAVEEDEVAEASEEEVQVSRKKPTKALTPRGNRKKASEA